jgi:hypothetical protein
MRQDELAAFDTDEIYLGLSELSVCRQYKEIRYTCRLDDLTDVYGRN